LNDPIAPSTITAPRRISEIKLFLFSAACAVAVANGYYIHPLIAPVGAEFGVNGTLLGLVPAFNQIALALGILLLLPLGDRINNRKLVTLFVAGQFLAMLARGLSQNFMLFVAASSLLGFVTITPYLLPAYVTKRVRPDRIGHVTGIMSAGITVGLLGSRAGGGVLGHYFGWRAAYWVGAGLTLALLVIIPFIMEKDEKLRDESSPSESYGALLASLWPIIKNMPDVLLAGLLQALSFGFFLALWLGIGLHLTSPAMGYGVDVVGYLAVLAVSNVFFAPWCGRLADRIGPEKARMLFATTQLIGAVLLLISTIVATVALSALVAACSGGGSESSEPAPSSENQTSEAAAAPDIKAAPVETGPPAADDIATLDGVDYASLTGDSASGKRVFAQCRTCHVTDPGINRIGSSLAGIIGSPAGSVAGFKYTDANKNSGITWTEEKMFQYLENPQRVIPKTRMIFGGIPDAQKRADLIAYLKDPS